MTKEFGWSISEVTVTFTLSIFFLGLAAVFGGLWMARVGPRTVGLTAAGLYGLGVLLASLSADKLWVLYLTYGVLAGIGLGFGYIVPVATLVKWFPDKRGMITGIAVAGFGGGALVTAPIATRLIESRGELPTFAILGVIYLIMVAGAALLMRNPRRATGRQAGSRRRRRGPSARPGTTPSGRRCAPGTGLVGIISIANGSGRFLWAWLSDFIGRKWVFLSMFLIQAVVFFLLPRATTFGLFATLSFIVLLCYGGGFGTMPAFAADYFGPKNVGSVYGLMLTAWGVAGIVGPTLIARIRESTGEYSTALLVISGIMLVSAVIPFIVRPPLSQQEAATREAAPEPSPAPPRSRTT